MKEKTHSRGRTMTTEAVDAPGADPGLDRAIQSKIGEQLRAFYDDVVGQGIPDRFAELLKQLDKPDDGQNES